MEICKTVKREKAPNSALEGPQLSHLGQTEDGVDAKVRDLQAGFCKGTDQTGNNPWNGTHSCT